MKITIKFNKQKIQGIENVINSSDSETMELLYTDLVTSQTMPFDSGDMQNNETFVKSTENGAILVTGSPQARRLYYHPEYNFQKKNTNAGAYWLEPYINGSKSDFIKVNFADIVKRRLK